MKKKRKIENARDICDFLNCETEDVQVLKLWVRNVQTSVMKKNKGIELRDFLSLAKTWDSENIGKIEAVIRSQTCLLIETGRPLKFDENFARLTVFEGAFATLNNGNELCGVRVHQISYVRWSLVRSLILYKHRYKLNSTHAQMSLIITNQIRE